MNTFIRNRRDKELCRARKAKRRLGLREQGKQPIGSLLAQPGRKVAGSAHSMSSSSSALIINQSDDSLLVSDLSTSHSSMTSAASNPDRSRVITRSEFDALGNSVQLLTQQMAIFLAKQSSQVHSDTPYPLLVRLQARSLRLRAMEPIRSRQLNCCFHKMEQRMSLTGIQPNQSLARA